MKLIFLLLSTCSVMAVDVRLEARLGPGCLPLGRSPITPLAADLAVVGNYAYVVDWYGALQVINVSNPANCVQVGSYQRSGMQGPVCGGLAVAGRYAYISMVYGLGGVWSGHLDVIDISTPSHPVWIGGCTTPGNAMKVKVVGNYAYVTADQGLNIIDVSDPTNCVRLGGCSTRDYGGGVGPLAVAGEYAYGVAENSLKVFDISNPTNCVRVGRYEQGGHSRAVAVAGNRIYAAGADLMVFAAPTETRLIVQMEQVPEYSIPLTYVIEASAGLGTAAQWTPVYTNPPYGSPCDFVDPDPNFLERPQRFYRARPM